MFSKWIFAEALPTWALFAEMALAGIVVIIAGGRFARLADRLADRLNLASGWVGLLLVATVTSLPELVSGGTAVAIGNAGMALAAIFGSCSFNITLIVLLNALWGGGSVLRGVSASHSLSSSFGILLLGIAMIGVVLGETFSGRPDIAWVCEGAWALIIVITYFGCMRLILTYERRNADTEAAAGERQPYGTAGYIQMGVVATVIVVASWWLAQIGDTLSTHEIKMIGRPLGATFVGAAFVAVATSLPEISTSVAAVRLGNLDLALGNIFGSNMFNIFVIPMLKAVSLCTGEPLLMDSGFDATQNLFTGLLAMLLTAIAISGLVYQSKRKLLRRFGLDSIMIAVVYAGGMVLLVMGTG